ncbi:bifunctional riboflavin kinase/FAD synthetase [Paracandidimonas soli]|uniref:Riboflavin biosynthesis protein n=1 Tax=Paracandidimonas soli TaxID=1917182 RepID=A0A4R3VFQ5_9BURK|nr:bifunctional riboflavin kinase/FAD synthetase [Paracandidimonas soli]TCV01655.1 riboflavin kinase/FMN adenylyltransferase [Paracandidimonas soli]
MKPTPSIYRHLPRHDTRRPSAVTIGNFDGVHLGHRAILSCLRAAAAEHSLCPTVMTFSPHPRAFFARRAQRPELIPTQISSLRDKVALLAGEGIEQIALVRFNQAFAELSPETFISRLLVDGLNTRWLLVGEDFRFGNKRAGDIALLRQAGERYGFSVQTIADVTDSHERRISSTDVRTALAVGELERARALLGAPFRISGHVIHGRKLGRTIGFPTLNLRVPDPCAARSGIYVVRVHGLADEPLAGVASLGVRPTVADGGALLLETHLLDRSLDAYGKLASVEFLRYLRDEEKFPDLPTLTAAIASDVRGARDYFAIHGL